MCMYMTGLITLQYSAFPTALRTDLSTNANQASRASACRSMLVQMIGLGSRRTVSIHQRQFVLGWNGIFIFYIRTRVTWNDWKNVEHLPGLASYGDIILRFEVFDAASACLIRNLCSSLYASLHRDGERCECRGGSDNARERCQAVELLHAPLIRFLIREIWINR